MKPNSAQELFIQQLSDLQEDAILNAVQTRLEQKRILWQSSKMPRKGCAGSVCAMNRASTFCRR